MPDDLYDPHALAWSERQAELLRRGELVNDVDREHVIEEIENVGLCERNAAHSYLRLILVNLLKLRGWPGFGAGQHWRSDMVGLQTEAGWRFAPSMRQRIDLEALYVSAVQQIQLVRYGGKPALPPPASCPVTLDQLLTAPVEDLEAAVSAHTAS
jgi:hypothetical protein